MNLKQAKELVRSRLSDKRYEHTLNVKKMAVKLAKHYGADEEQAALAALLRIGGDSFTLTAINDNLKGCGLNAVASETETPGVVEVRFPDVPGIPDGFESMRAILEDILPCHLDIRYVYWYITWALMEERFATWGDIEKLGPTWEELEKMGSGLSCRTYMPAQVQLIVGAIGEP